MRILYTILFIFLASIGYSQCDATVDVYAVDLTANGSMEWQSEIINLEGTCCGSAASDSCVEFVVITNENADALIVEKISGVFVNTPIVTIDCNDIYDFDVVTHKTPVICITPGVHRITICGQETYNSINQFRITSLPKPKVDSVYTVEIGEKVEITTIGFKSDHTLRWFTLSPGVPHQYDYLLDCISGCWYSSYAGVEESPKEITLGIEGFPISGCSQDSQRFEVQVNTIRDYVVQIPSAFQPVSFRGLGEKGIEKIDHFSPYNNVFYPITGDGELIETFTMKIYNRWGELICVNKDIEYGWDGYYRNKLVPQDLYFYTMEFKFLDGTTISRDGEVTVLY